MARRLRTSNRPIENIGEASFPLKLAKVRRRRATQIPRIQRENALAIALNGSEPFKKYSREVRFPDGRIRGPDASAA
jgi:hypothetical protein